MKGNILFLGYKSEETPLISKIESLEYKVHQNGQAPITDLCGYDLIISYGYRHILNHDAIKSTRSPVVNMHCSYLPYNRGAHPNFWSFYDNTPSGVTIHEIDTGLDTGPIISQKYVNFLDEENTFEKTYLRLKKEIEELMLNNLESIIDNTYTALAQRGIGSYHSLSDLPETINWSDNIQDTINSLRNTRESTLDRDLKIVKEIENVRSKNNVNWMDLLRIGLTHAPKETKKILSRISNDDQRIHDLFVSLYNNR